MSVISDLTRRSFLSHSSMGLGAMALSKLQPEGLSLPGDDDVAAPHFAPKAKRVIFLFQSGGPSQLELVEVKHGVKGIETLLTTLGMTRRLRLWGDPEPIYYRSSWVRADNGGILLSDVSLGSTVRKGDLLGSITDPMNNARTEIRSPYSGRIIGMARNQVVMPGFAAFHVGIETDEASVSEEEVDVAQKTVDGGYVDGMSE